VPVRASNSHDTPTFFFKINDSLYPALSTPGRIRPIIKKFGPTADAQEPKRVYNQTRG